MSAEENRQIVWKFIDSLKQQDYEALSDVLSEDFEFLHGHPPLPFSQPAVTRRSPSRE